MTVQYSKSSPYFNTNVFGNKFLDVMTYTPIDKQVDDVSFTMDAIYKASNAGHMHVLKWMTENFDIEE